MTKKKTQKPAKKTAKKQPVAKPAQKSAKKTTQQTEKQKVEPKKTKKTAKTIAKPNPKQATKTKKVAKVGSGSKKAKKSQKSKKKTVPAKVNKKSQTLKERKKGVSKKKVARGSSRYRTIQVILSQFAIHNGIKIGKDFNKMASKLYEKTMGQPLEYIEQNIDQLYAQYLKPVDFEVEFPDHFEFYMFSEKLALPVFENVKIGVDFKDDTDEFHFVGFAQDVDSWFRETLHRYCRDNYNESPVAMFEIAETDNKTYVRYNVVTGIDASIPEDLTEISEIKPQQPQTPITPDKIVPSETDKQIELERERAKNLQKSIELEKAQQETIKLRTAEIQAKLEAIQKLLASGFTKDEIKDMLK